MREIAQKVVTNITLLSAFSVLSGHAFGQNVGINTTGSVPHASSMLDVDAPDKGVLLPRIFLSDVGSASPVTSPATGLLVYNTNAAVTGGHGEGFYYWSGSAWVKMVVSPGDDLYIGNQNSLDQTGHFRITGTGRVGTSVQSPMYTRADAGTVGIRPNTNSTAAIQLQDAAGYVIMNVDATNVRIGINTDSPSTALDVRTNDAVKLPSGTTAQRPSSPLEGATRFNSDSKALEYYDGTQWVSTNMEQTPVGTIIPFAGASIPSGWLLCDGSAISRTTYQTLYNAIGTSWGSGDGSTTFNLPDLRGRFLRGVDGSAGRDPDAGSRTASNAGGNTANNVGSIQGDAVAAHNHHVTGNTAGSGILNTQAAGDHTHNVDPPNTTTNTAGNHQHVLRASNNDVNNSTSQGYPAGNNHNTVRTSDRPSTHDVNVSAVNAAGAHSHTVDIGVFSSAVAGSHTHAIADHGHGINLTSGNPSSANSSENRPKNANVTYIIKATSTSSVAIASVNVGSGILGQTLYNDGSNWIATSNLYNNGTQVAIGNTAPQQALSVTGGVNIDQANTNAGTIATALSFGSNSGEGIGSRRTAGDNQFGLDFYTQSVNRLSITSTGNVGISTVAPLSRLHVMHTSNADGIILQNPTGGAGTSTNISFATYSDVTPGISRPGARVTGMDDGVYSAHLIFSTKTPGTETNPLVERMRLSSNGNVGIGTNNPQSLLHVGAAEGGGIIIGTPNDPMGFDGGAYSIRFYGYRDVVANAISAKISAERTDVCCGYLSQGTDLAFYTNSGLLTANADNSIERLRIKDNGNVIVNNLSGTGTRPVFADATGTLTTAGRLYFTRTAESGAFTTGVQNVVTSGTLAVRAGEVIEISGAVELRNVSGSGNDRWRLILTVSGCAGGELSRTFTATPYNNHGTYSYYPYVDYWTATCDGNVQFTITAERWDSDDSWQIRNARFMATKK